MPRAFWFHNTIHPIDKFSNGSIFDHVGGSKYSPPSPPVPFNNILLESGFKILLENGDYIATEY